MLVGLMLLLPLFGVLPLMTMLTIDSCRKKHVTCYIVTLQAQQKLGMMGCRVAFCLCFFYLGKLRMGKSYANGPGLKS